MFNRDLFKKDLICICRFEIGALYIIVTDINGKVYKTIKCEDETVYNYFLEVFNL